MEGMKCVMNERQMSNSITIGNGGVLSFGMRFHWDSSYIMVTSRARTKRGQKYGFSSIGFPFEVYVPPTIL